MSFLTGRMTALRFKVQSPAPALFAEEHLDKLIDRQAGSARIASADGSETGWIAGSSVLDTAFTLEKNIVNDALLFDLRIDTNALPTDLLKAYYQAELKALAKDNPSGFASARQKREAKEIARDRLEQEAKDGRFKKRKCIPAMWDRQSNEVLFGATSFTAVDRFANLFEQTFGAKLMCMTAGIRAYQLAEMSSRTQTLDDAAPSAFVPGATDVAWIADASSRDYLGNELLLWLWFVADMESDTLKCPDGAEITFMLSRQLTLDCPRGISGTDGFKYECPNRLPEARRAIQAGKLPRKIGLTLVRHAEQFEPTLLAETLGIASAKLPPPSEEADARGKLEERIDAVRALCAGVDQLFAAFVELRLSAKWAGVLSRMQKWLKGEKGRSAA